MLKKLLLSETNKNRVNSVYGLVNSPIYMLLPLFGHAMPLTRHISNYTNLLGCDNV